MSFIMGLWKKTLNLGGAEIKKNLSMKLSLIGSKPCPAYFNPKAAQTELHTDASAIGLGALLLQ